MTVSDYIATLGAIINVLVFVAMYIQIKHLSKQTEILGRQAEVMQKEIQYSTYLRQIEQLNIINSALIDKDSLSNTFNKLGFDELLKTMTMADIGFSWLVINRYECAFVANELGVVIK
jgi:hypothetical protein